MNNRLYGNLIFELSKPGRKGYSLPRNNFGEYKIPDEICRKEEAALPECDEPDSSSPLYEPLEQQLWCRYGLLSPRLLYDEVQSEDQ